MNKDEIRQAKWNTERSTKKRAKNTPEHCHSARAQINFDREMMNLVPIAFSLTWGRGGKRPWERG